MNYQPTRAYQSNDIVMTPLWLAEKIVTHYKPTGKLLEPCCGDGSFLRYMDGADWCELTKGRDFMEYQGHVDWIITNPPWSKIRPFLCQSLTVADNVVFLFTINHLWTKARLRIIKEHSFGIREIILLPTVPEFPQTGFALGVVYLQRDYAGLCSIIPW